MGEPAWRDKFSHKLQLYAAHFPAVEVNSTFYRLPKPQTAQRWRALADEIDPEFEFTVKVSQQVTHRARFRGQAAREAFSGTAAVARLLRARLLLLQCPPSFGPTPENQEQLRQFLSQVDREGFSLVWEPRGEWGREPELVAEICREFSLIHCTDPFSHWPVTSGEVAYLRLHGAPPGERMYYYQYSDDDLRWLLRSLAQVSASKAYLFFNNVYMCQDALRLKRLLEAAGCSANP